MSAGRDSKTDALAMATFVDPMHVPLPAEMAFAEAGQLYDFMPPCSPFEPLCVPPPPGLESPSDDYGVADGTCEAMMMYLAGLHQLWPEEFGCDVPPGLQPPLPWAESAPGSYSYPDLDEGTHSAASEEAPLPIFAAQGSEDNNANAGGGPRWWVLSMKDLTCPLTGFPISLLPYPPFKLRTHAFRPKPHKLVDGKYLAMHIISTGDLTACGRELQSTDIQALDMHIKRCKLGPFRPGRMLELQAKAKSMEVSQEQRRKAAGELSGLKRLATEELGKLRRIQLNRMMQLESMCHNGAERHMSDCADDYWSKVGFALDRCRASSGASTESGGMACSSSVSSWSHASLHSNSGW